MTLLRKRTRRCRCGKSLMILRADATGEPVLIIGPEGHYVPMLACTHCDVLCLRGSSCEQCAALRAPSEAEDDAT